MSPLILPVMFAKPAKVVTETCVEPVTANGGPVVQSLAMFVTAAYVKRMTAIGGPVVTTPAFARPMRVTGVFGTPVCATAGSSSEAARGYVRRIRARDRIDCKPHHVAEVLRVQ